MTNPAESALVVVKHDPFNAEASLEALDELCTPNEQFYVRSNFAVPALDFTTWRLPVAGAVATPLALDWATLQALPTRDVTATLECAGNGRTGFVPLPKGEPWTFGAVSTARWRGVALREVLDRAGVRPEAVEILFEGADHGKVAGVGDDVRFARSLPLDKARDADTLLVYEMNGAPLPPAHGGPVRLLVPDWYGIASVKWLARIEALTEPFTGYYQAERYVYDYPGQTEKPPVRAMQIRALITRPAPGTAVAAGSLVAGMAWSGAAPIQAVEVSVDGDGPWQPARLLGPAVPHSWQRWEYALPAMPAGRHVLRARATDAAGNRQPESAPWNRLGYANNAIQPVIITVEG